MADVGGDAAPPGHAFYDRLQDLLPEAGFDAFGEGACKPYYAPRMGAPSLPPGRYFRMHMIGYFEGIDSERGIAWRCADLFSLRDFLGPSNVERVPDHSWLSAHALASAARGARDGVRLGARSPRPSAPGGRRAAIGVDGSRSRPTPRLAMIAGGATAAKTGHRAMLTRMAKESGIDTPSAEDLARFDRKRKGKTLSNADWKSRPTVTPGSPR